jgi:predicted HTH transcriptional regulator
VLPDICAFLNSNGGYIYLGVGNDSIVYGFNINEKWFKSLKSTIMKEGKKWFQPALTTEKYKIRKIPVEDDIRKIPVDDDKRKLNVIEIQI